MSEKLQPRQQAFISQYLADKTRNATKAAIAAGYSEKSASATAARLMRNPKIKAVIDEELSVIRDASGVTAQKVMDELARMAFFRPEDFVCVNEETGVLEYKLDKSNVHKLVGVTGIQMVSGHLRFTANKEKALELLVRVLEIENGDQDEDNVTIVFAEYPDDENSNRKAADV